MLPERSTHLKRSLTLVFFAILANFFLFLASEKFWDALYTIIFRIEDLLNSQPLLGTLSFFFLSALSAILAFASTIPLIPSAILVWGMPLTFFLLLGGWVAGTMFTYWIGSWVARPALIFFITEKKFSYYEQSISKKAKFWMILLFCLAVPSEIPGLIFGAMRYDFAKFISAVIIAETLYAFGSVLIAQNILDKEIISTGGILLLLTILITAASIILARMKQKK